MAWRQVARSTATGAGLALGLFAAGAASAQADLSLASNGAAANRASHDEVGTATWYGEDFDGHVTADGDRFDMYGLTAAHPQFPFNSVVEVTNLRNGRKVALRVNDRRAPGPGGVIVVSKAAAANLGFLQDQSAPVRVRLLSASVSKTAQAAGWTQAAE